MGIFEKKLSREWAIHLGPRIVFGSSLLPVQAIERGISFEVLEDKGHSLSRETVRPPQSLASPHARR